MRAAHDQDLTKQLRTAIERTGYYPEVVHDAVAAAVAGEQVVSFYVHHEPTFEHDEVRRHQSVVVLTPTRLVVGHTDDHPAEPGEPAQNQAATSTESVPLRAIDTVTVTRVVSDPARYDREHVAETWLTINWGALRRLDLEPAGCADPECEADHGYTGTLVGDDLVVRMSVAADGQEHVDRLLAFGTRQTRRLRRFEHPPLTVEVVVGVLLMRAHVLVTAGQSARTEAARADVSAGLH